MGPHWSVGESRRDRLAQRLARQRLVGHDQEGTHDRILQRVRVMMPPTPWTAGRISAVLRRTRALRAPRGTSRASGVRPACGSTSSAGDARPRRERRPCARPGRARARAFAGWRVDRGSGARRRAPSRTAQPGSPSWRQSLKRHAAASSAMSSKATSTPSSAPATSSARMPGVSMRKAPPGSSNSSRWVVVWRPRESSSRTAAVAWRCSPRSALTSVDLPTPDEPSTTAVWPGAEVGREVRDVVAGQRREHDDRHARARSTRPRGAGRSRSTATSALLRTTTGRTPLDQATAR